MVVAIFLLALTVLVCVLQSAGYARLHHYVTCEMKRPLGKYRPMATVILPCKGLDRGFDENVRKLLAQDYQNFEVIFAVASEDDPAYRNLIELIGSSPVPAKVVVAGVNLSRAQKINNQLKALQEISADTEVLVFVDSDVIARSDFISRLVAPLEDAAVGVTTGYRFYVSSATNWPSQLRALWNRMSAWELANPAYAFAWGGAMAVRRSVFAEAAVADAWSQAADDDLSLTTAIKRLGLRVHFVPQCLVASDGDATLPEIIEWTNRQLILTKVYYPRLWARAIIRASAMAAWLFAMMIAVTGWFATGEQWLGFATIAGLAVLPLEVSFLMFARRLWETVLTDNSRYVQESLLSSCLAVPLAHLVLPWMTLFSLTTNRIRWRGVTYELRSTAETLVIS